MTLFSLGKDSHKEKWEGARTSKDDILLHFRADDAQPITMSPSTLKTISSAFSNIYVDVPPSVSRKGRAKSLLKVCGVFLSLTAGYSNGCYSLFLQVLNRLVLSMIPS